MSIGQWLKSKISSPTLEKGDRVIMILGQYVKSIFENKYTPVSIPKSIYVVDENG